MLTLLTLTSLVFGFDVEEFDAGLGSWTGTPARVGQTSTPGWTTIDRAGDWSAVANPTTTKVTYYWRLTKDMDLTNAAKPSFTVRYDFAGGAYESVRFEAGPLGATANEQFTLVGERTASTGGVITETWELPQWAGKQVTVRVVLKKAYGAITSESGLWLGALGVTVPPPPPPPPDPVILSIGAFNIQVFGRTKMATVGVPEALVGILPRYDLIVIQEIRDISGVAIQTLLDRLNAASGGGYEMLLSPRLGRTSSKEQYAYFYRSAVLRPKDSYTYDDGVEPNDLFEREPFLGWFETADGTYDFATIPLHADPDTAPTEIDLLDDVVTDVIDLWSERDILLLGDFNASCNYTPPSVLSNLFMRTSADYAWWIDEPSDTTTTPTICAYDRILSSGDLTSRIVAGSSGVFQFDQALAIAPELTKKISDHYPVEILLELPTAP
jgi:deoxyribonuclease-1